MSRRMKSLDDPPTCTPTLAPPTEYIEGADHLPSKFWPRRHSKGPRPPLPPTPNPNFLTPGRISTQLAFDNKPGEILLLFSRPCNTRFALRRVSSSFCLSAANTGRVSSNITMEVRKESKAFPVIRLLILVDVVCSMVPFSCAPVKPARL